MPEWIITLLITVAAPTLIGCVLSYIAKKFPKDLLVQKTLPFSVKFADLLSSFLIKKIGVKAAEEFEEGIVVTVIYVIKANCDTFLNRLLTHNESRKN